MVVGLEHVDYFAVCFFGGGVTVGWTEAEGRGKGSLVTSHI